MRRRPGATAIASNPVLVGVATTLVIVVAVFLAYNANQGLPWVPAYRLTAQVPSAANLVKGNEARIGGLRVGVIDKITPKHVNGRYYSELSLKLETTVRPLPKDSSIIIRPRSALGLKYLQITKGHSTQGFSDGDTIPMSSYARIRPVDIDEFYSMFDRRTRAASRENLRGYGSAFAGRGDSINRAIEALRPLTRYATRVFGNVTNGSTRFSNFFRQQANAAQIVAPVAAINAILFGNLDQTFRAFAEVSRPFIQQSITKGPSGLDTATRIFPKLHPFFRNSTQFFAELKPGFHALRASASDLADAFVTGTTAVRRSSKLNTRLSGFLVALNRLSRDPIVPIALRDLAQTVDALQPTLAYLTPEQTVCNYIGLFFRNASFLLAEGDAHGTWLRFVPIVGLQGPNNELGPSSAPASGGGPDVTHSSRNFLHVNPYPNTAGPGQTRECEAGNESYLAGKTVIGNIPGSQGTATDEQKVAKKK
jgi:ABC-type transporter Mla subunit MlaD